MDGGLTELFLGVTAGAYLPLAVIAAVGKIARTGMKLRKRYAHQTGTAD